jgi:hypothetical protein
VTNYCFIEAKDGADAIHKVAQAVCRLALSSFKGAEDCKAHFDVLNNTFFNLPVASKSSCLLFDFTLLDASVGDEYVALLLHGFHKVVDLQKALAESGAAPRIQMPSHVDIHLSVATTGSN